MCNSVWSVKSLFVSLGVWNARSIRNKGPLLSDILVYMVEERINYDPIF